MTNKPWEGKHWKTWKESMQKYLNKYDDSRHNVQKIDHAEEALKKDYDENYVCLECLNNYSKEDCKLRCTHE